MPRAGSDPLAGAEVGSAELAQALAADSEGNTPGGRAAAIRHRFFLAARVAPREARRGRTLLEDLQLAEAAEDGTAADAAFSAYIDWVDAEAARIDRPRDPYEGAVLVAAQLRDRVRAGAEPPVGVRNRTRQWMLYRFDGGPETVEVLGTLVLSALRVGVRPWPWLRELLAAHAEGAKVEPGQWTPEAWQKRRR